MNFTPYKMLFRKDLVERIKAHEDMTPSLEIEIQFLEHVRTIQIDLFASHYPLRSMNDERLQNAITSMKWFESWLTYVETFCEQHEVR